MQQNVPVEITKSVQERITRTSIEVNGKHIKLPFFSAIPLSATDLKLLLEEFNPAELMAGNEQGSEVDFLNAVSYRVFEHDTVVREQRKSLSALTLFKTVSAYKYTEQTKLKIIDPATELYRHRYTDYLKQYLTIEDIPPYFKHYLLKMISSDDKFARDADHENFWNSLFTGKENGTLKSAHFLQWHWKRQKGMGADVFIPPVPYVSNKSPELIDRAIEMNHDAQDFIKDGEVCTTFIINMDLFNNKEAINKLTTYLDKTRTRITVFKFFDPTKILEIGFGQYARNNFELFLRVIRSIKEGKPKKVFGVLDGGAFGYALLGAGFDFFTDTVSNYPPYYRPIKGKRSHRGMINAETLSIEKFEGLKQIHAENNILMHDCKICNKYSYADAVRIVDRMTWSEDCRRHGLHMWNRFTQEYFEAVEKGEEKLFFDKIQNSDYAILGTILRNINIR